MQIVVIGTKSRCGIMFLLFIVFGFWKRTVSVADEWFDFGEI